MNVIRRPLAQQAEIDAIRAAIDRMPLPDFIKGYDVAYVTLDDHTSIQVEFFYVPSDENSAEAGNRLHAFRLAIRPVLNEVPTEGWIVMLFRSAEHRWK